MALGVALDEADEGGAGAVEDELGVVAVALVDGAVGEGHADEVADELGDLGGEGVADDRLDALGELEASARALVLLGDVEAVLDEAREGGVGLGGVGLAGARDEVGGVKEVVELLVELGDQARLADAVGAAEADEAARGAGERLLEGVGELLELALAAKEAGLDAVHAPEPGRAGGVEAADLGDLGDGDEGGAAPGAVLVADGVEHPTAGAGGGGGRGLGAEARRRVHDLSGIVHARHGVTPQSPQAGP